MAISELEEVECKFCGKKALRRGETYDSFRENEHGEIREHEFWKCFCECCEQWQHIPWREKG